jgi:DNA-binding response OmpR family regulator
VAAASGGGRPASWRTDDPLWIKDVARILVIEDQEELRRLVQRMLREAGHKVLLASESADGLRVWQAYEIDLAVVDIGLPGRSGLETILDMRMLEPSLPIIVISGREEQDLIDLITGAGLISSVRIVAKPFQIEELLAAVWDQLSPRNSTRRIKGIGDGES